MTTDSARSRMLNDAHAEVCTALFYGALLGMALIRARGYLANALRIQRCADALDRQAGLCYCTPEPEPKDAS